MTHRLTIAAAAAALTLGCADARVAPTAPASASFAASPAAATPAATMTFGRLEMNALNHMSPSGMQHTRAYHAADKVFPRTVVIERGQSVAFESMPVHQIAVYGPGTAPADIRLDPEYLDDVMTPDGPIPDVLINDPRNRRALSGISFVPTTWVQGPETFSEPGRYLVVCTIVFHYVEAKMYGWVEVR